MLLDQSSSQLLKTHFIGRDGFVWWMGQIASKESSGWGKVDLKNKKQGEELYYNRVKVRIFGYHTANGQDIPDNKLPWAHILIPAGEANGVGKIGKAHSYQGGETVIGFFLDGDDAQQPVIFGSLYKSSEIASQNLNDVISNGSSFFKPFNPTQPGLHNSLAPVVPAGQNVGTGVGSPDTTATPATGNSSGIENVASEQASDQPSESDPKDTSAAHKLFTSKTDNKIPKPALCNNNQFASTTAAIESLIKKLQNYQVVAGTYYKEKVKNKIVDFSADVQKVATIVAGDFAVYIKTGMGYLFEQISKQLGVTFGGLYPKTKQSEIGKTVDTILEAIYAVFKKIGLSLPDLVSDALTNFVGNAVAPQVCAVQNFVGQLLAKVLNTVTNAIIPLLDQINNLLQGALGSVVTLLSTALNLIGVINGLLTYGKSDQFCPKPQIFSIVNGVSFGPVISDFNSLISSFGNIGDLGDNLLDSLDEFGDLTLSSDGCDATSVTCGPPQVVITGGGGSGAEATSVVNALGQIVGVILNDPGAAYTSPPQVSFVDSCGLGDGAKAVAILEPLTPDAPYTPGSPLNGGKPIEKIVIVDPGAGYVATPIKVEYGKDPVGVGTSGVDGKLVGGDGNEYIGIVTGGVVSSPGYGYDDNTTVSIGNTLADVKLGADGEILAVDVSGYSPVTSLPEVVINSQNGAGAKIVPSISFVGIGSTQVLGITTVIEVIDCV